MVGVVARTKPPTEAEVAAEYFDRVQRTGRHEQDQRARDVEWARVLERRDALVQSGATTAWQITKALKLGAVPLDPVTWEPAADAITDPLVTLDYWAEHRDHAVGVKLVPSVAGPWVWSR